MRAIGMSNFHSKKQSMDYVSNYLIQIPVLVLSGLIIFPSLLRYQAY